MAVSRARKSFRVFLGITLLLSLSFFATSVYFYVNVRQKNIKVLDIAPTLFRIDIVKHQLQASLSGDDERLRIGKSLYQKGVFSGLYMQAGDDMILDLAERGHAEAQTTYADIIVKRPNSTAPRLTLALNFYRQAAAQGYEPAQLRLADLENADRMIAVMDAPRP